MILEDFQLSGKNALVTGSSRGLGAAIAIALAQAGANVGCHGRSTGGEATSKHIRQLGRKSFYLAGDMADSDFHSVLIDKTVKEFVGHLLEPFKGEIGVFNLFDFWYFCRFHD